MSNQSIDILTFKDFLRGVWSVKVGVLIGAIVGLITAYVILQSSTPEFEASMVIAPVQTEGTVGIQEVIPQNQRTAILKDILRQAIPTHTPQFEAFEHILTAHNLAKDLSGDEKIVKKIFHENWHEKRKKWQKDDGFLQGVYDLFSPTSNSNGNVPSVEDLKKKLRYEVKISPVGLTDFKRVTYRHPDPKFGTAFLGLLFQKSDDMLRAQSQVETEKRIKYLQKQLFKIRNSEHKEVLIGLLKEQERSNLISAVDLPFAARLIEPPHASNKPVSPNVWLMICVGLFGGAFIGGGISHLVKND